MPTKKNRRSQVLVQMWWPIKFHLTEHVLTFENMNNGYIVYTYICIYSSGMMVSFVSLHLFLWPLSDLLEHYPLVIWGVFACVVVVAVYREDVLGGGVVVIPPECEFYYCSVSRFYSG